MRFTQTCVSNSNVCVSTVHVPPAPPASVPTPIPTSPRNHSKATRHGAFGRRAYSSVCALSARTASAKPKAAGKCASAVSLARPARSSSWCSAPSVSNSTYTFSPVTGLICLHNIDSIQPAPHQAFFSALQAALNKIGLGGPSGAEGIGGVARSSPPPQTQSTHPVARS